jgi:hypothetical protein
LKLSKTSRIVMAFSRNKNPDNEGLLKLYNRHNAILGEEKNN